MDVTVGMYDKAIEGRTLYIPRMSYAGARMIAAAFQSIGIDARISPESDAETLELGARYTIGEECLPEKVTLGDFLKVTRQDGFDPSKTAFFMPTAGGPCRFGQYRGLLSLVLRDLGYEDVLVLSPTSSNGYADLGEHASAFVRSGWRAAVIGDVLTKALLRTRPYELHHGETDDTFEQSLDRMCDLMSQPYANHREQMEALVHGMERCRQDFDTVPADYNEPKLLIGVVGEIFCRLNDFSNNSLVRRLEDHGCEAWMSDVAEWIWYTNNEALFHMNRRGKGWWHPAQWKTRIINHFQRRDEHQLVRPFRSHFVGVEEPEDVQELLDLARPYLPREGSLGEMVLSTGKTVYMQRKGADGVVDISPFSCMNGIVAEAIYKKLGPDLDNFPIRSFYFDGLASDIDREIGIFVELATSYSRRKQYHSARPR